MKRFFLFLLVAGFLPLFSVAQGGGFDESSALSVFSENGDFFYLAINGVRMNAQPQTAVRVEGIAQQQNCDIQILFADNATREIRRSVTVANPVDRRAVSMVLKIVRERDGDAKLVFHKMEPKMRDYKRMEGEYMATLSQQYGDRNDYGHRDGYDNRYQGNQGGAVMITPQPAPAPPPPPAPTAMDAATFASAVQTINNSSFDDSKLSTAKTIIGANYVNVDQVIQICNLFSFENNKLAFAKFAYKRTVDNATYFKVNDVFSFDASKQQLNDYVSQNR